MGRVRVNGADLYVEERGSGVPILGIHGTPSSAVVWEDAAATLARHGRCLTYDRRGFARSSPADPARLDLEQHVADALALLDALDATPAIVVGRSTGGLIALELARTHPEAVRALVLLEPAVFTVDPEAEAWAARLRSDILAVAADDPARAAEVVVRAALGDDVWDSLPAEITGALANASPGVLAETAGEGLDFSARPRRYESSELAAIDTPTLILVATTSPEPVRLATTRLAERLPDAALARVPGGHLIDPASDEVLAFVDGHAD